MPSLTALALLLFATAVSAEVTISLQPTPQPQAKIVVQGLTADQLQKCREQLQAEEPVPPGAVYVDGQAGDDLPAMLGEWEAEKDQLVFRPRFPLRQGTSYRVELDLPDSASTLTQMLTIPAPERPPVRLSTIYPTRDRLPENLLKFYLQFSGPMSQGNSYRWLSIENAAGEKLDLPFLELPEELWSLDGTRMTILFDPGRIKRGLKPREESGVIFEAGKSYSLVVDERWPDAFGRPLGKTIRKSFHMLASDQTQPQPEAWKLIPPAIGSREPLRVDFGESLDAAMLQRVIAVVDGQGEEVEGEIELSRQETRWEFRPAQEWTAGDYRLRVRTTLEDNAGNSIGRPFEVGPEQQPRPEIQPFAEVKFRIAESPGVVP